MGRMTKLLNMTLKKTSSLELRSEIEDCRLGGIHDREFVNLSALTDKLPKREQFCEILRCWDERHRGDRQG